jgi:hypothetical protein
LPAASTVWLMVSPLLELTVMAMLACPWVVASLPSTTKPYNVVAVFIPLAVIAGLPSGGACSALRYGSLVLLSNTQLP